MPPLFEKQREEIKVILSTNILIWGRRSFTSVTDLQFEFHTVCIQIIKEDIVTSGEIKYTSASALLCIVASQNLQISVHSPNQYSTMK